MRSLATKEHNFNSPQHGMFCEFNRGNETGMVGLISEHAEVTDTRSLVSRKIVRVVPVGRQRMYDLEVACSTHNFLLPNGVVTSNSHACAYTYVSSRLLWLKAHYPLEFFAAILSCESQQEKLKEYKQEARRYGIEVMPVDVNKSGVKFQIVDNKIYFGLSNVKGVGEAVAQRIVDAQPYVNFADFLERFGTELGVLKPLLGLRVFTEDTPIALFKYYKWFAANKKRRVERDKRIQKRCEELTKTLQEHLPKNWQDLAVFTLEALEEIKRRCEKEEFDGVEEEWVNSLQWQDEDGMEYCKIDDIERIHDQYNRSVENYNKKKQSEDAFLTPFNPEEIEVPEDLMEIYSSVESSEEAYYGFLWTHPLEKSPDYVGGMSFEDFRVANNSVNPVECLIKKVEEKTSKKSQVQYWLLTTEDACGEINQVQVWKDDWERFSEELQEKALVRLRLKAPDGGFKRYTLESYPRNKKHLVPKKASDCRVLVLRKELQS